MAEERQGWYPGKHIKGLLGKVKDYHAKQSESSRLRSPEEQFAMQQERAGADPSEANQRIEKNMGFGLSQYMGKNLDVNDNAQVLQLQRAMNAAGIKGLDGEVLSEDGILGKNTLRALRFAQGQEAEAMSPEAMQLKSYGEPHGGIGPSYDNTYNEISRDRGTEVANPPTNRWERADIRSGRSPRTVNIRQGFGWGGRLGAYGADRFSGSGSNYPSNKDSHDRYE